MALAPRSTGGLMNGAVIMNVVYLMEYSSKDTVGMFYLLYLSTHENYKLRGRGRGLTM